MTNDAQPTPRTKPIPTHCRADISQSELDALKRALAAAQAELAREKQAREEAELRTMRKAEHAADWQSRAETAERLAADLRERVKVLEELLTVAACPMCDGSGSWAEETSRHEIVQVQCQWCYERAALLPTEKEKP